MPVPSSVSDRLAELGLTPHEARVFVLTHLDHPGMLAGRAFEYGITLEMLAEIVGGSVTGLEVAQFFAAHDIGAAVLEPVPEGDELEAETAAALSGLGVTREQVRELVFAKLDELHVLTDLAAQHGVTGDMIADIMGSGAVGQAVAALVRGEMEETPVTLVGTAGAGSAAEGG